jgi:uncharacterized protein (DUF1778 family)
MSRGRPTTTGRGAPATPVRLSERERELLGEAAQLVPCGLSTYLREAALERAIGELRSAGHEALADEADRILQASAITPGA